MAKSAKPMKHSKSLYYMQPDGSFKKGGDGRSAGLTKAQVDAKKRKAK